MSARQVATGIPVRLVLRRTTAAAALALLVGACFEPPVRERAVLRFLPNGFVVVTAEVEIDPLADDDENPALARRLAETRRALVEGWDPWGRRFERVEAAGERFAWEKRLGRLASARRELLLGDPAALGDVFADTALTVDYRVRDDGHAELYVAPGVPSRASRADRQEAEREIRAWSAAVADYLAAVGDLYDWLDREPDRALPAFARLFAGLELETAAGEPGELTEAEEARVEPVREAMDAVAAALEVPPGRERSLDELSHLVYDPFPAPLAIELPEIPAEVEGFLPASDDGRTWEVDTPGLWNALRALEGRWVAPDPVLVFVHHASGGGPVDLDEIVAAPRTVDLVLPSAPEIRRALEAGLAPASPVYRATWRSGLPEEVADDEIAW